eukprot:3935598-Rhodomonas_salina.1
MGSCAPLYLQFALILSSQQQHYSRCRKEEGALLSRACGSELTRSHLLSQRASAAPQPVRAWCELTKAMGFNTDGKLQREIGVRSSSLGRHARYQTASLFQ